MNSFTFCTLRKIIVLFRFRSYILRRSTSCLYKTHKTLFKQAGLLLFILRVPLVWLSRLPVGRRRRRRGGGVTRGDGPTPAEPMSWTDERGKKRQRDAELLRSRNIKKPHMSPLSLKRVSSKVSAAWFVSNISFCFLRFLFCCWSCE